MTSHSVFLGDRSPVPGQDPVFMETIGKNMRVPDRLSVGPDQNQDQYPRNQTKAPTVYSMQVPDRLTYPETPDMSPRPHFAPSKAPLLEPCWESPSAEASCRDAQQSPIRRSMSDQNFGRTPPGTPTQHRVLAVARQHSSPRRPPVHRPPVAPLIPVTSAAPEPPMGHISARSLLQMGLQASQRLLQTISRKYRFKSEEPRPPAPVRTETVPESVQVDYSSKRAMENWGPEDDGGAAVEFIVLRRQVLKMSRRLVALERHNAERRNTEFVLLSLLGSAVLLNVWLWIRR